MTEQEAFEEMKEYLPTGTQFTVNCVICTDPDNNQFCIKINDDVYVYYEPSIDVEIIDYNNIDDKFRKYASDVFDFDGQTYSEEEKKMLTIELKFEES